MLSNNNKIFFFICIIGIILIIALVSLKNKSKTVELLNLDLKKIESLDIEEAYEFYSKENNPHMTIENFKYSLCTFYIFAKVCIQECEDMLSHKRSPGFLSMKDIIKLKEANSGVYEKMFSPCSNWKIYFENDSLIFKIQCLDTPFSIHKDLNTQLENIVENVKRDEHICDYYVSKELKDKLLEKKHIINGQKYSVFQVMYANWMWKIDKLTSNPF